MVYVLTFPFYLHNLGILTSLSMTLLTQYLERSVIHLSQGKARYYRYIIQMIYVNVVMLVISTAPLRVFQATLERNVINCKRSLVNKPKQ